VDNKGQDESQPERLNEKTREGCDSLNSSITKKGAERNPKWFLPTEKWSNKCNQ